MSLRHMWYVRDDNVAAGTCVYVYDDNNAAGILCLLVCDDNDAAGTCVYVCDDNNAAGHLVDGGHAERRPGRTNHNPGVKCDMPSVNE